MRSEDRHVSGEADASTAARRCRDRRRAGDRRSPASRRSAEAGARVVIADTTPKVAGEGQAAMREEGLQGRVGRAGRDQLEGRSRRSPTRSRKDHGRVDILVNNAGIARSATPAEDTTDEHWLNVIDVNLNGALLVLPLLRAPHAEAGPRLDREHRLDVRLHRQQAAAAELLQRLEGRRASPDEVARGRMGVARRARQRGRADLYPTRRSPSSPSANKTMYDTWLEMTPMGAHGRAGGDRLGGALPRLRRGEPDDRLDRARRRRLHLLVGDSAPDIVRSGRAERRPSRFVLDRYGA